VSWAPDSPRISPRRWRGEAPGSRRIRWHRPARWYAARCHPVRWL